MTQSPATDPIRLGLWTRLRGRPLLADHLFYGWMILPVAMAAMVCTAPAQTYGVSVFTPHLREALALNKAQLAGAYALGTLCAALPLTWFGRQMDRHGIRKTMSVLVVMASGACCLMSQAQGLITVFLGFLALRMFGQSAMMLMTANMLPQWFNRRLGLASGVFALAPAVAIAGMPSVAVALIDLFSWRGAYLVLGATISVVMLPLLGLVFRNRPEDIGDRPDGQAGSLTSDREFDPQADAGPESETKVRSDVEGRTEATRQDAGQGDSRSTSGPTSGENSQSDEIDDEPAATLGQALRTRAYWIMVGDTGFGALAKTAIAYSAVSVFISRGMDQTQAVAAAARMFLFFGVTLAVVRLIAGYLADHVPLNLLLMSATTFAAMLMFSIWQAHDAWTIALCGTLMGMQQGAKGAVGSTLFRRYYGRANLGRIKGSFMSAIIAASALGPMLVDGLYDWVGSYSPILLVLALLSLPLMVLAPFATQPKAWQVSQGRVS